MHSELSRPTAVFDTTKLRELDAHELLRADVPSEHIASFDEIQTVGKWFFDQKYNYQIQSTEPLPQQMLQRHFQAGNQPFLAKLLLGTTPENHFPATVQVTTSGTGYSLLFRIPQVDMATLQATKEAGINEGSLALAAAMAVAPQFLLSLAQGIETQACSSKKELVTSITPDHGTPLAVVFDTFSASQQTLQAATIITQNPQLSIRQAGHMHGHGKQQAHQVTRAASDSGITAGIAVKTLRYDQLPSHTLRLPVQRNDQGHWEIVSLTAALAQAGIDHVALDAVSAVLGFTTHVVGQSEREKKLEMLLDPTQADTPIAVLGLR